MNCISVLIADGKEIRGGKVRLSDSFMLRLSPEQEPTSYHKPGNDCHLQLTGLLSIKVF